MAEANIEPSNGSCPEWFDDEQSAARAGHMLQTRRRHAPVLAIQKFEERRNGFHHFGIQAPFVGFILAVQAALHRFGLELHRLIRDEPRALPRIGIQQVTGHRAEFLEVRFAQNTLRGVDHVLRAGNLRRHESRVEFFQPSDEVV